MHGQLETLSAREKETLRLLLAGHDAKSIARSLSLSVHTVNERLRDARRKLGVSSSREAARLLAEAENGSPNSLGDKPLGVAAAAIGVEAASRVERRRINARSLAWLSGGMLVMSLVIAAVLLSSGHLGSSVTQKPVTPKLIAAASPNPSDIPAAAPALEWMALLDKQRWDESWDMAGTLFKSQLSKQRWAEMVQQVRQPQGSVSSRILYSAEHTTTLPGAPAGEYAVLRFRTSFAQRADATETIVLAHESTGWKVDGYFIL